MVQRGPLLSRAGLFGSDWLEPYHFAATKNPARLSKGPRAKVRDLNALIQDCATLAFSRIPGCTRA